MGSKAIILTCDALFYNFYFSNKTLQLTINKMEQYLRKKSSGSRFESTNVVDVVDVDMGG